MHGKQYSETSCLPNVQHDQQDIDLDRISSKFQRRQYYRHIFEKLWRIDSETKSYDC